MLLIKLRIGACIFFILLITGGVLRAQTAPKYSNEFMNIGVGARAFGMANAQTATVDDVTAGYWNPAALLQIKNKYQVALMHSEYFSGIAQYDFAAFATPVDSLSHIGVTLIRFGVDNIPDTRFLYDADGNINYGNVRFFNAADYAFLFSYARKAKFLKGLQWGANFKLIYRNVGQFANAWGFGLDAGLLYKKGNWSFGLTARDITGTFNAWTHNNSLIYDIYAQTGNEIPKNSIEVTLPKFFLGVGKYFLVAKKFGLLCALDLLVTTDGNRNTLINSSAISIDPNLGLEFNYAQLVYLRAGVNNFQQIKNFDGSTFMDSQFNFGLGFRISRFMIDYALTDVGNTGEALYSNVFSIKAGF